MMEKITAFFKQHWPDAANAPLVVLAVALVVAFLSLWLAKITGVNDEFYRLVKFILSSPVVTVGLIVGGTVWLVTVFRPELRNLLRPKKVKVGNAEAEWPGESVGDALVIDATDSDKNSVGAALQADGGTSANDILAEIKRKAKAGDAGAQNSLGTRYANGRGVERDEAKAVEWFLLAAKQGHAKAQNNLGARYANGKGVERDEAKAVEWYRLAAKQGNATAQNNLGARYANGRGVERDEAKAVEWFLLAAKQGHAKAQHNLGVRYARGGGVVQDNAEAVNWYRRAAKQGYARAYASLGWMYGNGLGVVQDNAEEAKWYRRAAEQGHVIAQHNLGWMYVKGQGVAQNYHEAYVWYSIATANGHEKSAKSRDDIAKILSAEGLAKAQAEAKRRMEEIRKRAEGEE